MPFSYPTVKIFRTADEGLTKNNQYVNRKFWDIERIYFIMLKKVVLNIDRKEMLNWRGKI